MADPEPLQAATAAAAHVRRVTQTRDEAILAAWRAGWSINEIAKVTRISKYRVRGVIDRLSAIGENR